MRSRPLPRRGGTSTPTRVGPLPLASLCLLVLSAGCGGDDAPRSTPPDDAPASARASPAPTDGPLATYRLSTTRSQAGDSLTIEALAPCRVLLEVVRGSAHEGARWRDLDPGDSLRIAWSLVPDDDAPPSPPGAADPVGQGKAVYHRLRYGFDEQDTRETLLRLRARGPSPWVRTALAAPPVSAKPFPRDGVALATLGIADVTSAAGLALSGAPVPAITGAPPGTPAENLQLVCLWLRLTPR